MKNLKYVFFLTILTIGINAACIAQNSSGGIQLEAGAGYGSEIQSLGIQGGGIYQINNQFRAAADAIYYFTGEDSNGLDFNWLEFNLNGHYLFLNQESVTAYLLTGLNFATLFSDNANIRLPGGDDTNSLYIGLNIGAGIEFPLGSINGFAEGKYALSSAHQLAVTGGLRIPLGN